MRGIVAKAGIQKGSPCVEPSIDSTASPDEELCIAQVVLAVVLLLQCGAMGVKGVNNSPSLPRHSQNINTGYCCRISKPSVKRKHNCKVASRLSFPFLEPESKPGCSPFLCTSAGLRPEGSMAPILKRFLGNHRPHFALCCWTLRNLRRRRARHRLTFGRHCSREADFELDFTRSERLFLLREALNHPGDVRNLSASSFPGEAQISFLIATRINR